MLLIRINTPNDAIAETIAREAVTRRLAACANIAPPIRSIYRWQGAIEEGNESLLFLKTRDELFDAVAALVRELHPDETPAILAIPVSRTTKDFADWLDQETRPD